MQEVLAHDAADAGVFERLKLFDGLIDRARYPGCGGVGEEGARVCPGRAPSRDERDPCTRQRSLPTTKPVMTEKGIGSRPERFARLGDPGATLFDFVHRREGAVVFVGETCGQCGAARAGVTAHDQWWVGPLNRLRLGVEVDQAIVLAVEGKRRTCPRAEHDFKLLGQPIHPYARGWKLKP